MLLFLRDDLKSDARRRREKKGERRFVRRRSVVAVFSGGILKRRAAKRNRIGIKEIRNRIGIVLLLLLLLRESFGKEKEGKKRRTTIFSLSTTTTKTPPPPVITCSTNLACVVVGLFSTRRRKKEKTTTAKTTRSNENTIKIRKCEDFERREINIQKNVWEKKRVLYTSKYIGGYVTKIYILFAISTFSLHQNRHRHKKCSKQWQKLQVKLGCCITRRQERWRWRRSRNLTNDIQ